MATRKAFSEEEVMKELAELESESDDDHCSLDSVYDSHDNDAPYIPEDFSTDSDSDSSYEPLRKKVRHGVQNLQQLFPSQKIIAVACVMTHQHLQN